MADKDQEQVPDDIHDIISDESVTIEDEKFEDTEQQKLGFIAKAMEFVKGNRQVPENEEDLDEPDTEDTSDSDDTEDTEEIDESGDETSDTDDSEEDGGEEETLTIDKVDARLVKAAQRRGWGTEKILKYAESDVTVLEDVANLMDRIDMTADKIPPKKEDEVKTEKPKGVKKVSFTDEQKTELEGKYGEGIVAELLQPLLDANNTLADKVNALAEKDDVASTEATQREVRGNADVLMKVLDAAEKEYPELGKWENVPTLSDGQLDMNNPVVKVRSELYDLFESFMGVGKTAKESAEDTLLLYTAKHKEDKVEQKIINKLNGRKKKFINRPGQRKVAKKFESVDDMKRDVIRGAMDKAGIKRD